MNRPESSRRLFEAGRGWLANSIGGRGYRRIREIDLDTHALALCAQQVLCTAPLIVAIGAVLQRLTGRNAAYYMIRFFGLEGNSADAVDRLFSRTVPASISTIALVLAMITALVFTTSVAAVHQRAFELIWTLPRLIGVASYLRQLIWAVSLGVYSIVVLGIGRFSRYLFDDLGWPGLLCIAVAQGFGTFLFYWWSQRWLLAGRVTWRALFPGAFVVGALTTIMFRLTRVILPGQISWQVHAYGLVGGVFVLSVWLMILSVVIFGGVLLGALMSERHAHKLNPDTARPLLTEVGLASTAADVVPVEPAAEPVQRS
ncbi:MAG TPA: YhjD/YihY/BrkB family envelope integrity protein [Jatrophihabitans sp.]|nr:YhjD/YihY/BrkB family envelope integrity protein [Jatrophihabitans sp.]